jgi:hypothetical protein
MTNITAELEVQMNKLFEIEDGNVCKDNRGSFVVGKCNDSTDMYVSFGWNYREIVTFPSENIDEVLHFMKTNHYEPYHSEDMKVYFSNDLYYLRYTSSLPGPLITKEEFENITNLTKTWHVSKL